MSRREPQALDPAIVEQAIQWLVRVRFNQADEQTQRSFEHWLQQRPEHGLAWQRVETLGDDFEGVPAQLARQTLDGSRQGMRRRESLKLLGVLATVGTAAWLGLDYTPVPAMLAQQRSSTGERRRFQLDDGSLVQLNSDSAVDSEFDAQRRLIILRRGEIIVSVGADQHSHPARPLWVQSRDGLMQAHSSRFLVRERDDGTLVAAQEGSVTLFPGARQTPASRSVQAGDQLLFTSSGVRTLSDTGLDPWSWGDGVISARNMRLGDFIAELSRYRPGVLRCAEEVADRRVSGTFQLADNDQVLALIAQSLHLHVDYRTRYWVTVTAAS
ncbi:FecR domain-containing protein [Pseudomonas granadensis]|uniref:FecR domain-containing protein n=1 Tax=Pseudomonas granadensis TaxID=1421430 RepID=UPI0019D0695A|nr:FecR domain-containing protein [Pseudomonas granadensis]MBN6776648.1 FecR domain-containing protein [Pseudomonas granadensis]MBN6807475.1 FecR domain-containing protein [Pseudomonas granadensis]MBN6834337.1 FecR domain-containing protein [Pseudomonas granadensis]MBN6841880.1 FecR domain-containing protein [Pseudomonas granadensis]MBN6870803.1 FecR domain-containing protein [Pseudomonas granadensis]